MSTKEFRMTLTQEVAENTGYDESFVVDIMNETFLQLHKRIYEYKGLNGDYIGEEMWTDLDTQAFYHCLGFLTVASERYGRDEFSDNEFLQRLGSNSHWLPFYHQMHGWKKPVE
jgi:hypothetical protein